MIICDLCPHMCKMTEGKIGACGARRNNFGSVESLSYGRLTALALDPVEKKPLAEFHPGSKILSAGSFGCNMRCLFCQNWRISYSDGSDVENIVYSPERLVEEAVKLRPQGNIGIAYTYNEPLVNYEYVLECSKSAREEGLKNVLVTNGMINQPYFDEILKYTDAANIDLKGFSDEFYRKAGGYLDVVKDNIRHAAYKIHLEVTTLIIGGLNDSVEEMRAQCEWLGSINKNIPLHLSRFFPHYKMQDKPATPVDTMHRLRDVAAEYLSSVYLGNI